MAKPSVFQALTCEEARTRAAAEGRWAIVVATSASSELGAMMDKRTWITESVCAWLGEKAVAIQVDVEADPALARTLAIETVPTVIAFKDDVEKGRSEGFRDAHHMMLWLMSLEEPQSPLRRFLTVKGGDLDRDMHGRLSYARALLHDQSFDQATEHYVWLWENIERVEPGMSGVRVSFMAGDMEKLAAAHGPAHTRFGVLRDAASAAAHAEPGSTRQRLDWIVLNKVLDDEARTLRWFDGAKADPGAAEVVHGVSRFLVELLKARGRWADLGRLYRNPLRELAFQHEVASATLPAMTGFTGKVRDQVAAVTATQFRSAAAALYASLRAAGRATDAKQVRNEALRLDPSDEMKAALAASLVRYD